MAANWALCAVLEAVSWMYGNRSTAFFGFLTSVVPRGISRSRGEIGRSKSWNIRATAYEGFSGGWECLDTGSCLQKMFVGMGEDIIMGKDEENTGWGVHD